MYEGFLTNFFKKRENIAYSYLNGKGIEIGALHQPLKINKNIDIKYVDRMTKENLRKHYPELVHEQLVTVDIIDDGEKLTNILDDSLDFIICNHMLEHCENPIGTLQNFVKKLNHRGRVYLSIPDKRYCFDKDRPLTTFEHLLADYHDEGENSREKHFYEWVQFVNKTPKEEMEKQIKKLMDMNYSIHYHVWDINTFIEFLVQVRKVLNKTFEIKCIEFNEIEVICILEKI